MWKLTGLFALPVLMIAACTEPSVADPALTFPETGVVCDPSAGFCSDKEGISLGFSEIHLGKTAAYRAFVDRYSKDDYASLEARSYKFSDGTYCDHVEMWCGDPATGEPNSKVAEALFAH